MSRKYTPHDIEEYNRRTGRMLTKELRRLQWLHEHPKLARVIRWFNCNVAFFPGNWRAYLHFPIYTVYLWRWGFDCHMHDSWVLRAIYRRRARMLKAQYDCENGTSVDPE